MATLRYSQVRAHPGGTIRYIADEDKLISKTVRDVGVVLNYMGEQESTERVFSFGQHCSSNPDLAEKQMELYRVRYFASKKGAVQGLKDGKKELLGLHFFLSYTLEDSPTEVVMNEIAYKIAKHLVFKDFAVFGANHFDKAHRHTHFFVCAYSADGKPRKLGMSKRDFDEVRRYANKLCAERGLSIIDLGRLRYGDPEYSAWIDSVIEDGKVTVHSEKEERKKWNKQKISTQQLYYKGMKEREERAEEEYRMLPERERKRKDFEKKYFCTQDSARNMRWYVSGSSQQRFYVVQKFDLNGNKRSRLELIVRLLLTVAEGEGKFLQRTDPALAMLYNAKVATELQGLYDYFATASKMNITKPEQIADRIADVGAQMNALKKEKSKHKNSIKEQERIIAAYKTYIRVSPVVENAQDIEMEMVEEYKSAYAVLAQNQVLTDDAYEAICRRYEFEMRKVTDYEKRLPELKRQYRDLKKLEALAVYPERYLERIYRYSLRAHEKKENGDVDRIINDAASRASNRGNGIEREMER